MKFSGPLCVGYAKSATDVDCPEETLNWHILTAGYRARWMDTYDEFAFGIRCCKFLVFGFTPSLLILFHPLFCEINIYHFCRR